MKKAISTDKAPAAIGPYSQAIEVNGMVYTSGVIPVVPSTGEIPEGAAAQADQAIGNLAALLKEAGTSTENVVKTTVFIKNMEDFGTINEVYAKYFTGTYPARSCVEVAIAKRCPDRDRGNRNQINRIITFQHFYLKGE